MPWEYNESALALLCADPKIAAILGMGPDDPVLDFNDFGSRIGSAEATMRVYDVEGLDPLDKFVLLVCATSLTDNVARVASVTGLDESEVDERLQALTEQGLVIRRRLELAPIQGARSTPPGRDTRRTERAPLAKSLRKEIMERDAYRCQQCGDWNDLEIDHIVALANGGSNDDPDNLQVLCGPCNRRKGARL